MSEEFRTRTPSNPTDPSHNKSRARPRIVMLLLSHISQICGSWRGVPCAYECVYIYIFFPQQRICLWGLQSVKQRRGDWGFGSRVPASVRDVCALDYRSWIWIQVCLCRANTAVCRMNMSSCLRTERDPSELAASERSSLFDGTCLFAHGA